ncbi:hypothetical protein [Lysobacter solisilvae (ex Woo and Kim 2020)]|uniref:Uncharacterized protein n=1 Tax=Agrilutibacter terrestris TaxID=2865112 RepID=A0A7H0FXN1_9GAMM|nr:hypothetical protein [Lysobacter terrestris]QNP40797.1 hypothetical protein H8B22_00575 [Lysobacter terrestris]
MVDGAVVKRFAWIPILLTGVLFVGVLLAPPSHAHSPVTSGLIYEAYLDLPQVRKAHEVSALDDELADYILDPGTSYDEAAAVINALGRTLDNHLLLLQRLKKTDPHGYQRFRAGKGSSRVLFAVGYMWATDEYYDTRRAELLLAQAERQSPEFFVISLVHALVIAQSKEESEWCEIFRKPRDTIARYPNGLEMRRAAVQSVLDYTDTYAESCGGYAV